MADIAKQKALASEESTPVHRIRITLTSRNVGNLEKGEWGRSLVVIPSSH